MQILKKDLLEILNGNQQVIERYKEKYFSENEHRFVCEQCGKVFYTSNNIKENIAVQSAAQTTFARMLIRNM